MLNLREFIVNCIPVRNNLHGFLNSINVKNWRRLCCVHPIGEICEEQLSTLPYVSNTETTFGASPKSQYRLPPGLQSCRLHTEAPTALFMQCRGLPVQASPVFAATNTILANAAYNQWSWFWFGTLLWFYSCICLLAIIKIHSSYMVEGCTEVLKHLANFSQILSTTPHLTDKKLLIKGLIFVPLPWVIWSTSSWCLYNSWQRHQTKGYSSLSWHVTYLSFTYMKFIIYGSRRLVIVNCVFPETALTTYTKTPSSCVNWTPGVLSHTTAIIKDSTEQGKWPKIAKATAKGEKEKKRTDQQIYFLP